MLLLLASFGFAGLEVAAVGAEFYVNRSGSDRNSGTTRSEAFATIQKGVDALAPGDTLHIGPGEYREAVSRTGLGREGATTTIRAEIVGSVVLRGNTPLVPEKGFRKEEGFRFVYSAPFEGELQCLIEDDTLTALQAVAGLDHLDNQPGSYFFDPSQKRVYFSPSDLMPPTHHRYSVSIDGRSGLELVDPVGVVIEGIAVTGFQEKRPLATHSRRKAGIKLTNPVACKVEQCTAYLNSNGIVLFKGSGNRIERCEAYGNGGAVGGEGGNIIHYYGNNSVISESLSYRSSLAGIRFYLNPTGPVLHKQNIAWGNLGGDLWIKGGTGAAQYGKMEHSIAFGRAHVHNLTNSLVSGRNNYQPEMAKDNLTLPVSRYNEHFADPYHQDFRLQSDSSLLKRGIELATTTGKVFYLSAKGDDQADGTSVRRAWKSLEHAIENLKAGDTLYLLEGSYRSNAPISIKGSRERPIAIRARGLDEVVIETPVVVESGEWVSFERLIFAQTLRLESGGPITIDQCRFDHEGIALSAVKTKGLTLTQNEFTTQGTGGIEIDVPTASVTLAGNIFNQRKEASVRMTRADSIRYSDYNSYARPLSGWEVAGKPWGFQRLKAEREPHSSLLLPDYQSDGKGRPQRVRDPAFLIAGPLGKPLGRFNLMEREAIRVVGPFLHSVSDTTANVEWWTSEPAECLVAWGTTPDCPNQETYKVDGFGSFSLGALEPDQRYYFKLLRVTPALRLPLPTPDKPLTVAQAPLAFTTASKPAAPATYHVAPDGDDGNDGLDRKRAWRKVAHAADKAGPGDTVLIHGGTYEELVPLRRTGAPGRPITFRAAAGEQVVLSGGPSGQGHFFSIHGKSHLRLDGFYFRRLSHDGVNLGSFTGNNSAITIYRGNDIEVERCFHDGRELNPAPGLLAARETNGLTLRNSVAANGWFGVEIRDCDQVLIEHNVFLRNFILALSVGNPPEKKVRFSKNIVTDSLKGKARTQLMETANPASLEEVGNLYHLRLSDEEKRMFFFHRPNVERYTFAQTRKLWGDHGSFLADSALAGAAGLEPDEKGDGFAPELLLKKKDLDFPDLVSTQPRAKKEGIGLQIKAFGDFHFNARNGAHPPQAANRIDNPKGETER